MARTIEIAIEQGDVTTFSADVIAFKYAQDFHGADRAAAKALETAGIPHDSLHVHPGKHRLIPAGEALQASNVLFVGTAPLYEFNYQHLQALARDILRILGEEAPRTRHLAMTAHGAGFGLDEEEALRSQLFGYLEALRAKTLPAQLERISIISNRAHRVATYRQILEYMSHNQPFELEMIGRGIFRLGVRKTTPDQATVQESTIADAGKVADEKPHVFVAMPFGKETDDLYHYGIRQAVHANDLLCVRVDKEVFMGEIFGHIRAKIDSAALVVAILDDANPNVYLEVGYAWGKGRPTILLIKDVQDLRFDVMATRCLVYDTIQQMEAILTEEIRNMRATKQM